MNNDTMNIRSLYTSFTLLCVLATAALLDACDKTPINGDLDGMWQLMTVQTPGHTREAKNDQVYMCIQLHMVEWRYVRDDKIHFYSHFRQQSDSLYIMDLSHASTHSAIGSDDVPVTASEMALGAMEPWGIHTLDMRYRIRQLDADHLSLEKADTLYTFRKF